MTQARAEIVEAMACPDCDGRGWIEDVEPECCGRTYASGACRGECAVPKQVQRQCESCNGSGEIEFPGNGEDFVSDWEEIEEDILALTSEGTKP